MDYLELIKKFRERRKNFDDDYDNIEADRKHLQIEALRKSHLLF